ncbi:MAG: cupin [Actinomycetia bacterium]|nr:cupin [Actinomycetes bacterium]
MTAHRRVVVGHAADGSSFVAADEQVDEVVLAPRGNRLAMLWGRDDVAALPAPVEGGLPPGFLPPAGGWRASLLTFPPDDTPLLPEGEGVGLPDLGAQMAKGGGRGMHTTPTVDVVLVVGGELWLEVDDGSEVRLQAGDTVVQNGTRHGWRNKSGAPATLALFMVGADHGDA